MDFEEDGNIIIRSNVPKNEIEKTYKKEIIKDIHRCIGLFCLDNKKDGL